MLRAKSTRKRVASAVARECAEMSRASVESSKSKKRTRRETTAIQVEANPSGPSRADVTVDASLRSVGEVFVTDQGSPHESAFVPSNSVDPVYTNSVAPKPVDSIENSLGFGISHQVKEKIIKGEYIEMSSLLEKNQYENGEQTVSVVNGELVIQKIRKQKINNVEVWTDAFINFIGVFCSVHKDRCNELLKYMYTIRLGAKRLAGHGWVHYDEQFRLRKALNPSSSWAVVDTELWLLYMNNSGKTYGSGGAFNIGNSTAVNRGGPGGSKCYAFNYGGYCHRQFCIYNHTCLRCEGSHSLVNCPHQSMGRATELQRPQFQNIRQSNSQFNINRFSRQFTPGLVNNNRYGVSSRPRFTSPVMGQRK